MSFGLASALKCVCLRLKIQEVRVGDSIKGGCEEKVLGVLEDRASLQV